MKSFKVQNACILMAIIMIDAVAYFLMGELLSGDHSLGRLMSLTIYIWHGVNAILLGYLIFLTVKTKTYRKTIQVIKNNKNDFLTHWPKGKR